MAREDPLWGLFLKMRVNVRRPVTSALLASGSSVIVVRSALRRRFVLCGGPVSLEVGGT